MSKESYRVDSFFLDESAVYGFRRIIAPVHEGKITLKILFDGINKSNTISVDDIHRMVTPFSSRTSSQLNYSVFSGGYIKISNILSLVRTPLPSEFLPCPSQPQEN